MNQSTEDDTITLTVSEKIFRAVTNNNVTIPNLNYQNFILNSIELESNTHEFEISVRYAGNIELMKLSSTYFKNNKTIDLSGHRSKLEEGDNVDLVIRPKHKSDFTITFHYKYALSNGVLYYQNTFKYMDIQDANTFTFMADITQKMRPTKMWIYTDEPIKSVSFSPRFVNNGDADNLVYVNKPEGNKTCINFDSDDVSEDMRKLLKYYNFELTLRDDNTKNLNDSAIHILVYGLKQL